MAEKATVFQGVQFGIETTPGTEADADKQFGAVSLTPVFHHEGEGFTPMFSKYPTLVVPGKDWTEFTIDGRLTYNEIVYLLSSLFYPPTSIPKEEGATSTYVWTFGSNQTTADAGVTFTVEQGDATSAWQSLGVRIGGLEITVSRTEASLSGGGLGGPIATGITMTASPTQIVPQVILPQAFSLKVADSQSGLASASALTRAFNLVWTLTDKIAQAFPIGSDIATTEAPPTYEAKLQLATDTVGLGFMAAMRGGTKKWFELSATGPAIETGHYYKFDLVWPAIPREVSGPDDKDSIMVVEYTLQNVYDADLGGPFALTINNELSAL